MRDDGHVEPDDLPPGDWWIAHDHPERPADVWTVWSWACDPCFIHLVASARLTPEGRQCYSVADDLCVIGQTLSEVHTQASAWRIEHDLWVDR